MTEPLKNCNKYSFPLKPKPKSKNKNKKQSMMFCAYIMCEVVDSLHLSKDDYKQIMSIDYLRISLMSKSSFHFAFAKI